MENTKQPAKFELKNNQLYLNGVHRDFGIEVLEAARIPEGILLTLNFSHNIEGRNIVLIDDAGEIIWKIKKLQTGMDTAYTGFFIRDAYIQFQDLIGYVGKIDPKTGDIEIMDLKPYG